MNNLDKAREWAEGVGEVEDLLSLTRAAVEVILSLPDRWIGMDEVREAINDQLSSYPQGTVGHRVVEDIACKLQALLDPPPQPRTLGDMSLDELKTHVGGEVMVDGWANPTILVSVIDDEGAVLAHRMDKPWPFVEVLPLTKLSPVEEPEQEAEVAPEPAQTRPEDVPVGEPWIVQHGCGEWVGCRNNPGSGRPWFVIGRDYHDFDYCHDGNITLVSRLIPEEKENE